MRNFLRHIMILVLLTAAASLPAQRQISIPLGPATQLDPTGNSLREALNAYEAALLSSGFPVWTRITLGRTQNLRLGPDSFLLLSDTYGGESASLVFVGSEGPESARVTRNREATLGPFRLIFLNSSRTGQSAEFLIRDAETEREYLSPQIPVGSSTKVLGYETPKRLVVSAANPQLTAFASDFVAALSNGKPAEEAAADAWRLNPPVRKSIEPATRGAYTDPTNIMDDLADEQPYAAAVDLNLVRGDESALREIMSEYQYRSDGNVPTDPRISASGGAQGGSLDYGSPGDRFRARLRALEREGRINSNSSTLVRVPLGGYASFDLNAAGARMSARLYAKRSGREHVILDLDNQTGDWSSLGSVTTRIRVRDGQTIPVASNTSSLTSEQSSGPPLVGNIPYIGVLFGNSRRTSENSTYALFATVRIE